MRRLYTLFILTTLFFSTHAQTFVQFINNSGDSTVLWTEVTMNNFIMKDSLGYRKATSFLSVAGNTTYTITFHSRIDTSLRASTIQTLETGRKYVFVLNGVGNDTTYTANPDGNTILLHIEMIDQSAISPPASNQTTIMFINGSTDMPSFDLKTNDSASTLLIDNESLNQVQTTTLADTATKLKLLTSDGAFSISVFLFDFTGLGGQVVTALTSGFIAPGVNKNGPNFSVYLVDSSGNVISTQNVSLVHNRNNFADNLMLYPNPARDLLHIRFTSKENSELKYQIFDLKGERVCNNTLGFVSKGENEQTVSLKDLVPGVYFLQLQSDDAVQTVSLIVQ